MARIVLLLCVLSICFYPQCASAQSGSGIQTDTVSLNNGNDAYLAPSINLGVFAMLGNRTSYCPETIEFFLDAGLLLKADLLSFNSGRSSIFVRASGALGLLTTYDAGLGIFLIDNIYLSASYAYVQCPSCEQDSPRFDPWWTLYDQPKAVTKSLLVAAGWGRRGFLFELDIFLYFEDDEYRIIKDDIMEWVGTTSSTTSFHQGTVALRIGYSF